MPLNWTKGPAKEVNRNLILSALTAPALFIDAANCTNIHAFPDVSIEKFQQLYIIPAESLYRFKPSLLKAASLAGRLQTNRIYISTFTNLFNYDNQEENENIFRQSWKIIVWLGKSFQVTVGVEEGSIHERFVKECSVNKISFGTARKNTESKEVNMGHTIWSQRINSDIWLEELKQFGKALREEDRKVYTQLLQEPLKHLGSITYTSSAQTSSFLLLSILLEQQKKINQLQNELAFGCV